MHKNASRTPSQQPPPVNQKLRRFNVCEDDPSPSLVDSPDTQLRSIGEKPSKGLLLQGNLTIWVYEAKELPSMDMFNSSDPYVTIAIANAVVGKTYADYQIYAGKYEYEPEQP
ncbi:hypothetical protein LXL04_036973 [Taraxacum kok-saghyz]